jgi:hypothetical protein
VDEVLQRRTLTRERVIRTLLNHPEGSLTKYRVAKLSKSPWTSTHRILNELQEVGLVRGTRVEKFKDLLGVWANWKVKIKYREYLVRDPLSILRSQKATTGRLRYALTTYQAENLIQNYLFPSRIDLYIRPRDTEKWYRMLAKEGALAGKGNFRLILSHDEHVFYNSHTVERLHVVSIPQLIVDLFREGGVCVEAANMLLDKIMVNGDFIRGLRD